MQWCWSHLWSVPALGVLLHLSLHAYLKYTSDVFVTEADWKGSICLKYFLFSKLLEGEICVTARTTLSLLISPYVALFKLHLHAKESPWRCFWSLLLQWSQQISPCWISPLQMCSRSVSQEPRFNKNELPDTWKFYMCSKKSNGMRVTVYL